MNFSDLNKGVIEWASQKGILTGSNPIHQSAKMVEEAREAREAIVRFFALPSTPEAEQQALMELGDTLVTICIVAKLLGTTPETCLEMALAKIQQRTGKMVGGIFVKDSKKEKGSE